MIGVDVIIIFFSRVLNLMPENTLTSVSAV